VDLFKEWCGYCSVMEPTYARLAVEVDDFDERVKLLAIPTSKLPDDLRKALPVNTGCKPSFAVFKHRVVIGKVNGVNGPELAALIRENAPPPKPKT
jgi:thiol-disulfide isomerase/thioredoxin